VPGAASRTSERYTQYERGSLELVARNHNTASGPKLILTNVKTISIMLASCPIDAS
jgi:hypothetical protein